MSALKRQAKVITSRLVRADFSADYVPMHKQALDFSNTENPLGCSPNVIEALSATMSQIPHYPDRAHSALIAALSARHSIQKDHIFVGNGATGCIQTIVASLISSGKLVVLPEMSFPLPIFAATTLGGAGLQVPMADGFRIDFDRVMDAVTPQTGLIFMCNPNNPTGLVETPQDILAFAREARVPVLVSEANVEYEESASLLPFIEEWPDNLIVVRSFSKAYGLAGLRVGFGVAAPDMVQRLQRFQLPFAVSGLSECLAIEALKDTQHVQATKSFVKGAIQTWQNDFESLGFEVMSSQSNTLLVAPPPSFETTSIIRSLDKKGITVIYGGSFHPKLERFIRLAPRNERANKMLIDTVAGLLRA